MRSPNYPTSSLPVAVECIKKIWRKHERKVLTIEEIAQALGYKGVSGPTRSKISAIKKYGLLAKQGNGLRVSDGALVILHKPADGAEYRQAIEAAIHGVDLFSDLMKNHHDSSEGALKSHMLVKLEFTEDGAKKAAQSFLETKALAESLGLGTISSTLADEEEEKPKVGDYVQWTSQSVAQFLDAKKLVGLSDDGEYAFVEGERGGVPMSELSVVEAPPVPAGAGSAAAPPANPLFKPELPEDVVLLSIKIRPGLTGLLKIPKMTETAFEFFKQQLDAFEDEIVADSPASPRQDENHDAS